MTNVRRIGRLAVALALVSAALVGAASLVTEAEAAPCRCPLLYAPVQCDNGKTYTNQCFADCRNARNCVPTGGGIE